MDDLRDYVRVYVEQFYRSGLHSDDQIWAYLKHLVRLIRIGRGGLNANVDGELLLLMVDVRWTAMMPTHLRGRPG